MNKWTPISELDLAVLPQTIMVSGWVWYDGWNFGCEQAYAFVENDKVVYLTHKDSKKEIEFYPLYFMLFEMPKEPESKGIVGSTTVAKYAKENDISENAARAHLQALSLTELAKLGGIDLKPTNADEIKSRTIVFKSSCERPSNRAVFEGQEANLATIERKGWLVYDLGDGWYEFWNTVGSQVTFTDKDTAIQYLKSMAKMFSMWEKQQNNKPKT